MFHLHIMRTRPLSLWHCFSFLFSCRRSSSALYNSTAFAAPSRCAPIPATFAVHIPVRVSHPCFCTACATPAASAGTSTTSPVGSTFRISTADRDVDFICTSSVGVCASSLMSICWQRRCGLQSESCSGLAGPQFCALSVRGLLVRGVADWRSSAPVRHWRSGAVVAHWRSGAVAHWRSGTIVVSKFGTPPR